MLKDFADVIVYNWLQAPTGSMLGEALDFFFYDTMKVFLLLVAIIFAVAVIRSFFPPERSRKLLGHRREYVGNFLAASLGIVTPFCSCSAVPMFIGFVESGLPLGVTFSFLISSPTVNEVALVMLWGLFGWKIAFIYIATGVIIAFFGGIMIGKLKLEHLVEDYVYKIKMGETENGCSHLERKIGICPGLYQRHSQTGVVVCPARDWTRSLDSRICSHGFGVKYAGPGNPFAVIVAVLIGIPLYSNAAGTIPIIQALVGKGLPMGTALAFMMSIVAISTPEMIILRKVIKPKLIAIFTGIVAVAIVIIGYLFNAIL